ncbi:MAG TPA: CDP-alcohol phosphatidyltransferase family protein [Gemmatimonadales bacterium]|nr:CDP-alcohol phosphatidyltransferase family protein [Gemmatimonadales bacterium]
MSWLSFAASAGAAVVLATGRVVPALIVMAAGQVLDGLDGGIARVYGLGTPAGARLDTALDRASETLIFLAAGWAGLAPWRIIVLALAAIYLMTSIAERSGLDPGVKRFALYFGLRFPYPLIFTVIFAVNLAAYAIGLLVIDCKFQITMDRLGGDLDTVASRAVALEVRETRKGAR